MNAPPPARHSPAEPAQGIPRKKMSRLSSRPTTLKNNFQLSCGGTTVKKIQLSCGGTTV